MIETKQDLKSAKRKIIFGISFVVSALILFIISPEINTFIISLIGAWIGINLTVRGIYEYRDKS